MGKWLLVFAAVEPRDTLLYDGLKSFIDSKGNQTKKVYVSLLLRMFCPVAAWRERERVVLSALVAFNHVGIQ